MIVTCLSFPLTCKCHLEKNFVPSTNFAHQYTNFLNTAHHLPKGHTSYLHGRVKPSAPNLIEDGTTVVKLVRRRVRGTRRILDAEKRKSKSWRPLRKAILAGYATRLARRMAQHNGYKTIGPQGSLAQLHPSCASLMPDEDGLMPEWVVYHELLQTARTFISKVNQSHSQIILAESFSQYIL